jgi:hypothetical protein
MALGGSKIAMKYLNPDLCYAAWVIGGSVTRGTKKLADSGLIHPLTGSGPSRMGVHYAAKVSEYYIEFAEKRVRNPKMSPTPTRDEYAEAQEVFNTLIQVEVKKSRELFQNYHQESPVVA